MTVFRDMSAWLNIVHQEAARAQLKPCQLLGRRRHGPVVKARHAAWKRMRDELKLSYPVIARLVQRDHTTVRSGVIKINETLKAAEVVATA